MISKSDLDESVTQSKMDFINAPLTTPVGKLDADEYTAEDLDGVTESLFGSGNMAYASLQASQTDRLLNDTNEQFKNEDINTDTDRPVAGGNEANSVNDSLSNEGGFASSTVGSVSVSQGASDTGNSVIEESFLSTPSITETSSQTGKATANITSGKTPQNGAGGNNTNVTSQGRDGRNGDNGKDGSSTEGSGDTIINEGDIIDLGNTVELINQTFIELGDIITSLTQSVSEITNTLNTFVENLTIENITNLTEVTENVSELVETTINEVTEVTENVTNLVNNTVNEVTNIVNENITNISNDIVELTSIEVIGDVLTQLNSVTNTLQTSIQNVTNIVNEAPNITGDILIENITNLSEVVENTTIIIDNKVGIILDNIGLGGGESEGDVGADLNLDIAELDIVDTVEGALEETLGLAEDITEAIGIEAPVLETVESILDAADEAGVGSILEAVDETIIEPIEEIANQILENVIETGIGNQNIDLIVNPVEDLAGDLDANLDLELGLLNSQNGDEEAGEGDITISLDNDLIDSELLGGDIELNIDPVEEIIGEVNLELGLGTDSLGDSADGLINNGLGGSTIESPLSEIGDQLEDIAQDLIPGLNADDNAENDLDIDTNIDLLDETLAETDIGAVLDPLEEIMAGDIDSALDINTDLLNSNGNETNNAAGDSDLSVDLDINILGQDVIDTPKIEVQLDPVEEIIGDVDLDISSALNLLGGNNDDTSQSSETNGENGGESEVGNWTESIITDGGGLFDDLSNNLDGATDALPDPVATVGEGLGALDVEPVIEIVSWKGLFG